MKTTFVCGVDRSIREKFVVFCCIQQQHRLSDHVAVLLHEYRHFFDISLIGCRYLRHPSSVLEILLFELCINFLFENKEFEFFCFFLLREKKTGYCILKLFKQRQNICLLQLLSTHCISFINTIRCDAIRYYIPISIHSIMKAKVFV